ncbi:MAG: SpoIID/LytB domain-containing protein, partial [Nitrospirae bacterium]
ITSVPEIRVRVFKGSSVQLKGSLQVQAGSQTFQSGYVQITLQGGRLYVSGYPVVSQEITIKPLQGYIYIQKSGKWRGYRGYMKAMVYKGNLIVVNYLNIEEYLYSVVTSESYAGWPLEALKAQATAARTYALYQSLHRKNWPFDVVDDEGDQAYKGIGAEDERGITAVSATTGMVLTWQSRPILAMYTASTGWYVDDPKYIFGTGYPYLQLKRDPYSEREKMGRWQKEISVYKLEQGLRARGLGVYGIYDLVPSEQSPSGRIIKIRILHQKGQRVVRTYTTIRKVAQLPDILMTIRRQGNKFVFYGGGYGHGVGYSQWGGKEMAEQGFSFEQILGFYYPGATLQKLW